MKLFIQFFVLKKLNNTLQTTYSIYIFHLLNYKMENTNFIVDPVHTVKPDQEFSFLDSEKQFNLLTNKEQLYAYYMQEASWVGSLIIPNQISSRSHDIIMLFYGLFENYPVDKININIPHMTDFLNYAGLLFASLGNYLSFGSSKFIPNMSEYDMTKIFKTYFPEFYDEYSKVSDIIFSLNENEKFLGYYPNNTTTYLKNITEAEASIVNKFVLVNGLEGWNTMSMKTTQPNSSVPIFIIFVASINKYNLQQVEFDGLLFEICYGMFSNELVNIVDNLQEALKYVANETQQKMLESYIAHFTTGNLEDHKQSQRYWVKDLSPSVETNLGFIENYTDPSGIRSEFESFVAIVDKDKSKKYTTLVNTAQHFLSLLPWSKDFEKEVFVPPDFTALDVITFVTSGIPAGINIPNYDDVRRSVGFKNVSLDNVLQVKFNSKELPKYLNKNDGKLFVKYIGKSFDIQVAGHELLGHGSGKLFNQKIDGTFDFNTNLLNPINNLPITTWYNPDETYSSKFGKLASSYEECRAECVGLLLSTVREMYDIFNDNVEDFENVMYVNWLNMVRSGMMSLDMYDQHKKSWNQAHSRARYAIFNVLKLAGIVNVNVTNDNFVVILNKDKIYSIGVPAINDFLLKLNIYKTIADIDSATTMFGELTEVCEQDLIIRNLVIKQKKGRGQLIQPTLFLDETGTNVGYKNYPSTVVGMVQSFIDKLK